MSEVHTFTKEEMKLMKETIKEVRDGVEKLQSQLNLCKAALDKIAAYPSSPEEELGYRGWLRDRLEEAAKEVDTWSSWEQKCSESSFKEKK